VTGAASGKGNHIESLVLCCDYLKPFQYAPNGLKQGTPFWATISDDGSFVFPFVSPGNYALSIIERNSTPVSLALAVGPNGLTGLQLNLTEGVEVQGTVQDQNGKSVSANVRLVPKPPANPGFNAIGQLTYTGGRPVVTQVAVMSVTRSVLRAILVPRVDPSLDAIQNLIQEAATIPMHEHSLMPGQEGQFKFQNVFPGTYVLEVNAGGVALPGREIQVGITGLSNLVFQVPAVQLTGSVVSQRGGPLPKLNYIRLALRDSDADVYYGFPNAEGDFSLTLLPGEYRVFTENLGSSVQSITDGSRDITNTNLTIEGNRNPQIVVTLRP